MDKTYQKLESRAVTFCYPISRTLQNLKIKGLHKKPSTLFSPDPFSIEHIVPRSKGGSDLEENLAFSCQGCNGHKHIAIEAIDPINGESRMLYNPRIHQWDKHFVWDETFSIVIGRTAIGRATIERLRLNRAGVVNLRQVLRKLDRHPPQRGA
jgi:hypothetical protein